MCSQFVLSLKKEITLTEDLEKQLILKSSQHKLTFKPTGMGLRTALKHLVNGGATIAQLSEWMQQDKGYSALKLYPYLQKFSCLGWLCHSVIAEKPIAIAIPTVPNALFSTSQPTDTARYSLSQFALMRQIDGQMILESPLSLIQIHLIDWRAVALVAKLASPRTCAELTDGLDGGITTIIKPFLSLLLNAQMLTEVLANGTLEETNTTLTQWEFHDLLFHTYSRIGRHSQPIGGTYRFKDKIEPLPMLKPRMSQEAIALYRPDLETLKATDIPFTRVLESRKSVREYGEAIDFRQLGEFLYRTARIKNITQIEGQEFSQRPYPSGGGLYELELYPVINDCQGIVSGIYHYHPQEHQLYKLSEKNKIVESLLTDASLSMGGQPKPPILIVITARFQRLAWKYERIAYALMLKHVGALYQTMYLVATAMNLAPCGLGCGDSDLFARAINSNYYAETSVGEFALGTRKMDD